MNGLGSSSEMAIKDQLQLMAPLVGIAKVARVAVVAKAVLKHLMPKAPASKVLEITVPEAPALQVTERPVVGTTGAAPAPPETRNEAHSLAIPTASPTAEPAAAALLAPRKFGRATAERMPTIATTIISSIRVKPLTSLDFFSRRLRITASWVLGEMFIGRAKVMLDWSSKRTWNEMPAGLMAGSNSVGSYRPDNLKIGKAHSA